MNPDQDDIERNWLWLAIDQNEQLAAFQSLGEGAIPRSILTSPEEAETVDHFIECELLPTAGTCNGHLSHQNEAFFWRTRFPSESYKSDWEAYVAGVIRVASCGLFVYYPHMNTTTPSGYFQVAYPSVPLTCNQLPPQIRTIVASNRFRGLTFESALLLTAEEISRLIPELGA